MFHFCVSCCLVIISERNLDKRSCAAHEGVLHNFNLNYLCCSEAEWRQTCSGNPAWIWSLHESGGGWDSRNGSWRTTEQHRHGGESLWPWQSLKNKQSVSIMSWGLNRQFQVCLMSLLWFFRWSGETASSCWRLWSEYEKRRRSTFYCRLIHLDLLFELFMYVNKFFYFVWSIWPLFQLDYP